VDVRLIFQAANAGRRQNSFDIRSFLQIAGVTDWWQSGEQYKMQCPRALTHHNNRDRNHSFYVKYDGACYCHGCHAQGGRRELFKLFELDGEQIDDCFTAVDPDSVRTLAPAEPPHLPKEYEPFYYAVDHGEGDWEWVWNTIPDELLERGLTSAQFAKHEVGMCCSGIYASRAIFPVKMGGELRGFVARWLGPVPENEKKVLFPRHMRASEMIYNIDAVVGGETLVVSEGAYDALALERAELPGVSVFGSRMSKAQAAMLLPFRTIVLMPDADDAGQGMIREAMKRRLDRHAVVKVARLPKGDPNDYGPEELRGFVAAAVKVRRAR
jgi:hypothetical protein